MENLQFLMHGFAIAIQPTNLLFALMGSIIGTMIGVLPGIGPEAGVAILIPITFVLDPTPAIIMLSAIYYGSLYGGTITSVLINTPGEPASAITCVEGYEMAKQGRAGPALAVAAIGSFIGGTFATFGLALVAIPLSQLALKFGPPEFFSLMLMGLSLVTGLAGRSLLRALMSTTLGLLITMVGIDPVVGAPRFAFDQVELLKGFGIVAPVMGLFGIGEIMINAETGITRAFQTSMRSLVPTSKDMKDSAWPIVRGTAIGFSIGFIPGVGATIPTFMSYIAEKKLSKTPEKFGTGMIEGVAGPETANNAYGNAALIPLFTLGIPGSVTVAVIMGAFIMNGLIPGPMLFTEHADFVWAVIASLYIGNFMLLILNLPLIPLWVAVLKIPYSTLFGIILAFCVVGAYSLNNSLFDIGSMLAFGILGYLMKKLDIPIPPMVLPLILGPMMERALRQSLELSDGDFSIFFIRPISAGLLVFTALFIIFAARGLASTVKEETAA